MDPQTDLEEKRRELAELTAHYSQDGVSLCEDDYEFLKRLQKTIAELEARERPDDGEIVDYSG